MKAKVLVILIVLIGLIGGFFVYKNIIGKREVPAGKEKSQPEFQTTEDLSNWPMLGRNSAHHNFYDGKAPNKEEVFWSYDAPEKSDISGLVYQDGKLYFSFGKLVSALNLNNNKVLWTKNLGWELNEDYGALALTDNKLIVQTKRGIQTLNAETGEKLWSYKLPLYYIFAKEPNQVTPPVVAGDKVFFGSNDDNLYAIRIEDGKLVWRFKTQGNIHSIPAVSDDKICFGTEDEDWSVYCLKASTGEILWRKQFATSREAGGGMFHVPAVIFESLVLIGEEGGGKGVRTSGVSVPPVPSNFYALDINSGEIVWKFLASDWIVTMPAVAYEKVYFSSWDGNIYALDVKNGELVWKAKGGSSPIVADKKVFVGSPYSATPSSEKAIFAYNAENGEIIWQYQTEDIPRHLIIAEGKLYVGFTSEEEEVIHNQIIGFGDDD